MDKDVKKDTKKVAVKTKKKNNNESSKSNIKKTKSDVKKSLKESETKIIKKSDPALKEAKKSDLKIVQDSSKKENEINTLLVTNSNIENNKKESNKNYWLVLILIFGFILIVFGISMIVKPNYFKKINYDKYNQEVKNLDSSITYVGNNNTAISVLKDVANELKLDIFYINSDKLNDDEKATLYGNSSSDSRLFITVNGKTVLYFGDYTSDSIKNALSNYNVTNDGLKTIGISEYLNVIKKDGMHFMFIGSSYCSYCVQFKPIVEEIIKEYNIDAYYVDLSVVTSDEYDALVSSNSYFSDNNWGTPTSFIYKNGESIGVISGYKDKDTLLDLLKKYEMVK